MMQKILRAPALVLAALVLTAGCATAFSPQLVRDEIVRQQGKDPREAFELNLGRFTTLLLKQALTSEEGKVPFAGLSGLELAVFDAPSERGPAIDVTRIPVRGWEPIIRLNNENRSGMVLVRGGRSARRGEAGRARVADLVVVGSGTHQVIYARLWGSLDPDLPSSLGDVLREEGVDGVRGVLSNLAGEGSGDSSR